MLQSYKLKKTHIINLNLAHIKLFPYLKYNEITWSKNIFFIFNQLSLIFILPLNGKIKMNYTLAN